MDGDTEINPNPLPEMVDVDRKICGLQLLGVTCGMMCDDDDDAP